MVMLTVLPKTFRSLGEMRLILFSPYTLARFGFPLQLLLRSEFKRLYYIQYFIITIDLAIYGDQPTQRLFDIEFIYNLY